MAYRIPAVRSSDGICLGRLRGRIVPSQSLSYAPLTLCDLITKAR